MTEPADGGFGKTGPALLEELEAATAALNDAEFAESAIKKGIAEAKSLLQAGNTADAEHKYLEMKMLLSRAMASVQSEPLARQLLRIELLYLLVLLAVGYVVHQWPDYRLWSKFLNLHAATAWFGALGGVAIGVFGLYTHVQARDFDPKFELWYLSKPIMGAIFGWFVFLLFYVGFLATGGSVDVKNHQVLYAISFLAGFSERFTIKIIDRLMQVLTTWEEKPSGGGDSSTPAKK